MDQFQVILPSALLTPYVKQYWFVTIESVIRASQRLMPLGCIALIFHRGNRTYSTNEEDYLPQSYLYGIATGYNDLILSGNIDFICIIFHPAAARFFFKIPLSEFNNNYISINLLGDMQLDKLEQRLNNTTDNLICVSLIEQFLINRISQFDKYNNKRINTAINSVFDGETNIDRLAGKACLSYKQFNRTFTTDIGINPKDFVRIVRFQKLHHLLQLHSEMTIEQLASECGYYDKSHLIKELKKISGFTPQKLLEACEPIYSGYHALFRSAFVDIPS